MGKRKQNIAKNIVSKFISRINRRQMPQYIFGAKSWRDVSSSRKSIGNLRS